MSKLNKVIVAIATIITGLWFGCIANVISNANTFEKVFIVSWALVLIFCWLSKIKH